MTAMSLGPGEQVLVWTNTSEPRTGTVKYFGNMTGWLVIVKNDEPDVRDGNTPQGGAG